MNKPEKSKGHINFEGDYEYFRIGNEVYRAHISNVMDGTTNARIGRWECSVQHWERYYGKLND